MIGVATNALLQPTGHTVRVLEPLGFASKGAALLVAYTVILGMAWFVLHVLFLGPDLYFGERESQEPAATANPKLRPARGALIVSLIATFAIPALLLLVVPVSRATISPATAWAIPTALGVFALGWIAVGASLRPNGSIWRGAAGGFITYVFVGILWLVAFSVATGSPASLLTPLILVGALLWPLLVAQAFGLFGLQN